METSITVEIRKESTGGDEDTREIGCSPILQVREPMPLTPKCGLFRSILNFECPEGVHVSLVSVASIPNKDLAPSGT